MHSRYHYFYSYNWDITYTAQSLGIGDPILLPHRLQDPVKSIESPEFARGGNPPGRLRDAVGIADGAVVTSGNQTPHVKSLEDLTV
jgi:hypothetical protein